MIQDIQPYGFSNAYQSAAPDGNSYLLCYTDKEVLIKWNADKIDFPRFSDLEECNEKLYESCTYLFSIDDLRFYLAEHITCPAGAGYAMENTLIFRSVKPRHLAFAGITGAQLYRWYQGNSFCGRCQTPMVHSDKERMVTCPKCGQIVYPKISPAVIVGVTHGDKILMSKYAGRDYSKYALLAGFTEIGESVEETIHREVMEEVGLKVKNIRYYKSQPWSFSDTLLIGFYAELDGGEEITLDREELAMAEWFKRDEITVKEHNLSLTNEMIIKFKNGEV